MNNPNLYAVLLGGKIRKNDLMEDHSLVFVAAEDDMTARELAKKKWAAEEIHIDGTQQLHIIDGYQIHLENTGIESDSTQIDPKYSK